MEYNTDRDKLVIPEYGRNVQKLIQHAQGIEDEAHRQAFVEKIVKLITQMHPQVRNIDDYRDKVWAHVFLIANYELNVKAPCEIPSLEMVYKRPERVPYPGGQVKFKHYGKNVESMVEKARNMEESEKKKAFIQVVGSYMKLAYRSWNQEYVNDEIIRKDLETLSEGEVVLPPNTDLDSLVYRRRMPNTGRSGSRDHNRDHNRRSNNNGGSHGSNYGNNRRSNNNNSNSGGYNKNRRR